MVLVNQLISGSVTFSTLTESALNQLAKGVRYLHLNNNTMSDENQPVRVPEDKEGIHEIAEEGEEDSVTKEQREALAETQAKLIGDL